MLKFFDTKTGLDGSSIHLSMPISKVDVEKRMVHGFATLDNIDRQQDVIPLDASVKAFEKFRGNLREQHDATKAVGKVLSFEAREYYDQDTNKNYNGIFVSAYVSKGAQDTWEKVLDGTLSGFSVGGRIMDYENKVDQDSEKSIRIVKDFELMELSLVDSPANQLANIFSIEKVDDNIVTSGIATEVSTENVYWCETDKIAISDAAEKYDCPSCRGTMHEIGWVESNDVNKNQEIGKIVDGYLLKAESLRVGDFVSWNSSGGTARGKVERIARTGSINVPNSDFTINAEEGDPAVLIRVWRKGADGWAATDTRVGHKMSTLRRISSLAKSEDVEKETITSENTPDRQAQQGMPGAVSASVSQMVMTPEKKYGKKKRSYKADGGDIEVGSFVAYRDENKINKGRVEEISENIAEVRLYKEFGNKFISTYTFVYKSLEELTKLKVNKVEKKLAESVEKQINSLVSKNNEKYGNVDNKKVDFEMLRKVFERGLEVSHKSNKITKSNKSSSQDWAMARVSGFLHAVEHGKFKKMPYDTDLLPKGHPLSTIKSDQKEESEMTIFKNEGGVEVADNETSHEELDTAQAEEASVEEVEFEVEETIEDVVNEALAVAKADSVEAEEAEDTSSDVFDMEKALGDVKSFVEEAITKSSEASTESLQRVSSAVVELAKAIDEKVGQLQSKYEEVTKGLADLNTATVEIANRVESVEEDTAMKKSGELENSIPEQPVVKKSLWGGRFLSSAEIIN